MTSAAAGADARTSRRESVTVELRDLSKTFGAVHAVDRVSAVALPGQVTALLGPNGAGKTTILRVLLGLASPERGHGDVRSASGMTS